MGMKRFGMGVGQQFGSPGWENKPKWRTSKRLRLGQAVHC